MTAFIFRIPAPSVEISGRTERFAVRRIFCVGRNYAEHAREFGNDERDPPFFFTKPADAIVPSGAGRPMLAMVMSIVQYVYWRSEQIP